MRARYCLLYIKGDWSEYASTFGFPTWADSLRPCFACNVSKDDMSEHVGVSPSHAGPWRENEDGDYDRACSACEILVVVTEARYALIMAVGLTWDKRDGGSKGLALNSDVVWDGRVQLQAGDRVEPTTAMPDVNLFLGLRVFPVAVLFWRPSCETIARHRNPIFKRASPTRVLTVDVMHAINLGVMHSFCRYTVWFLLLAGVWSHCASQEETVAVGANVLRVELRSWYKARHQRAPGECLTRIDLRPNKLGDPSNKALKTKAAETFAFLVYLIDKMEAHSPKIGPPAMKLLEAGRALLRMMKIMDDSGLVMTTSQINSAFDAYQRHLALTDDVDDLHTPKRHLVLHLLRGMQYLGNPRAYSNWHDETLNRFLKQSCRSTSQKTFEPCVLLRMLVRLRGSLRGSKRKIMP